MTKLRRRKNPDFPNVKMAESKKVQDMSEAETQEYRRLVNLWHCTEPMTKEQTERLDYLHGLTIKRVLSEHVTDSVTASY